MHVEDTQSYNDHQRHISVVPAIRKRGAHNSNIWIFDSPKNNKRFTIAGDVAFMHLVLLEGDISVERYDPNPAPVQAMIDGDCYQTTLDAIIYFRDGRSAWWEFKRTADAGSDRKGRSRIQLSAQAQAASTAGAIYEIKTEKHLKNKDVLFDNWLLLCAAITRARNFTAYKETRLIQDKLRIHGSLTLGALFSEVDVDPALALSVVARLLQIGVVEADLEKRRFGLNTVMTGSQT